MVRRLTFRHQARLFLKQGETRIRKPMKPATLRGFRSNLNKWLLPHLGDCLLAEVNNGKLRALVSAMHQSGLSSKSINSYIMLAKLVVTSAVDEEGEVLFQRKWNSDFIGLPLIKHGSAQTLSGGSISKLLNASLGRNFVLYALLAGTGLRIGEAFGLQVEHFSPDFRTISVRQSVWNGAIQSPKTDSAIREVDLNSELASLLREFVGDRKNGLLFQTWTAKPLHQSNTLRRHLHPTLMGLDIQPVGFHAFRRFRVTHLRKQRAPEDLVRAWLGHSSSSITDRYSKVSDDVDYRREVVEHVALGFDLPKLSTVVNY